jgi:hypothetical protein
MNLATSMRIFRLRSSRLHMAEENDEQTTRDAESEQQQQSDETRPKKLRDLNPEKDPMGGAAGSSPNE